MAGSRLSERSRERIRRVCSGFTGPFTARDVMIAMMGQTKYTGTTNEISHYLSRIPGVEVVGRRHIGTNCRNTYQFNEEGGP